MTPTVTTSPVDLFDAVVVASEELDEGIHEVILGEDTDHECQELTAKNSYLD